MCEENLNPADVQENQLLELHKDLLAELLKDRSTGKNIIWATDDYAYLGAGYGAGDEILPELITGERGRIIMPRSVKPKAAQTSRTRNMAEVFTPTWICNKMNNLADAAWFGRENVFNSENGPAWTETPAKIVFPNKNKRAIGSWTAYVAAKRLEITCGEAPYLVSRYDAATGEPLPLERRVGLLDRKLRVVNERTRNLRDKGRAQKRWLQLAKLALQSVYGFEWQGDNVLLARENLLYSVMDYFAAKFGEPLPLAWLPPLARIISWNIWQMDGIKCVVPHSCHDYKTRRKPVEPSIFDKRNFSVSALKHSAGFCDVDENELQKCQGCLKDNMDWHNGTYCKIKNWSTGKVLRFKDLLGRQGSEEGMEKDFKFDVVIGNPPYQDSSETENKSFQKAVYHYFLDSAYEVADKVLMIHPARFLFNAGSTPKSWNEKMLSNPHLKVVYYESDGDKIFSNTSIPGGIAVTYYDANACFEPIGIFTPFMELNSIKTKVLNSKFKSINSIMYLQNKYNVEKLLDDHPECMNELSSSGKDRRFRNNAFAKVSLFTEDKISDDDISVYGVLNNQRVQRYFPKKYIDSSHENLFKYKVCIPSNYGGAGAIGENPNGTMMIGEPILLNPSVGYTQTFLSVGAFENKYECENALKYIKTKFCRLMLGILKITPNNPPEKWEYVPLQNFSSSSDIDWSGDINNIDRQLYKKYNLTQKEVAFIESMIKPMD